VRAGFGSQAAVMALGVLLAPLPLGAQDGLTQARALFDRGRFDSALTLIRRDRPAHALAASERLAARESDDYVPHAIVGRSLVLLGREPRRARSIRSPGADEPRHFRLTQMALPSGTPATTCGRRSGSWWRSGDRLEAHMKYKIALQKTDEGYSASVPGLPGCWSQGATEAEALENVQDAIHEYLAVREELLRGAVVREVEVA